MSINQILHRWQNEPTISENIVSWVTVPQKPAEYSPFPGWIDHAIIDTLKQLGVESLYTHQALSLESIQRGENPIIVTSTASGKTFCYLLAVLHHVRKHANSRAMLIFPTKALAQDQLALITFLLERMNAQDIIANIYDGDTPEQQRSTIRKTSHIIITNPDMLHTGILPHHAAWREFFTHLHFVVLDEVHVYRGIFGSHVANVIRRLKRIAGFHGSTLQFIATSATIGNPQALVERIIESPAVLINENGAPRGEKHFLMINPPFINQKLGIRSSSLMEGTRIASELIRDGVQTIAFLKTRRGVELGLTYLRNFLSPINPESIRGYRSGYLKHERRSIEQGLRSGDIRGVVSTSALELGIDIGSLDSAVIIGYPGSISATRQQAGRAGRKQSAALAVLITSANPLDQYLANHPEYLHEKNPEHALIEPDNLLILLQHIRCASFELPFEKGECFGGSSENLLAFLELLAQNGELVERGNRYFWMADQYPAVGISLRSASPDQVSLIVKTDHGVETVGQVDKMSAFWMVHPGAIYLHDAVSYLVDDLDLEKNTASLQPISLDYYTQPKIETQVDQQSQNCTEAAKGCQKYFGELLVTSQLTGFKKIRYYSHEILGAEPLAMPPTYLNTMGYWFSISEIVVNKLREQMLWNADANDYGANWHTLRQKIINRDGQRCRMCGASQSVNVLHVHHIKPFRSFSAIEQANEPANLVTLCASCHHKAEQHVKIRSGLSGVAYLVRNIAPLLVMCDWEDLGIHCDPQSQLGDGQPTIAIYDEVAGGIGLSDRLFQEHDHLLKDCLETVTSCRCDIGCPACVGPVGEDGYGGKKEAIAILEALT